MNQEEQGQHSPSTLVNCAQQELAELRSKGLYRELRTLIPKQDSCITLPDGRSLLNFSSNDYLGLTTAPQLKEVMAEAAMQYGVGSGASRLVSGHHSPHEELELTLASFKGTEAALAFSSGHATAIGVVPALCGSEDTVILDKLSHASLIDASKLSGATIRVFPHNNLERLEKILASVRAKDARGRVLIITESIFSMDGDAAPLAEIVALKEKYGAWLLVDEAHAVGVTGPQGRGLAASMGLENRVELQMGTLSKAIGVSGGYVAAARPVIDLLINRARSLIYSTAPPAALAKTASAAIQLIQSDEGEARRTKLHQLKEVFCRSLFADAECQLANRPGAILPVIIGKAEAAVDASLWLQSQGYFIPAIRYPTVARDAARLRITLSALHELIQIKGLVSCLHTLMTQLSTTTLEEV